MNFFLRFLAVLVMAHEKLTSWQNIINGNFSRRCQIPGSKVIFLVLTAATTTYLLIPLHRPTLFLLPTNNNRNPLILLPTRTHDDNNRIYPRNDLFRLQADSMVYSLLGLCDDVKSEVLTDRQASLYRCRLPTYINFATVKS